MQEEYQKSSVNLNLFLVVTRSQKVPGTAFKIVKYVQKIFSLVVHHLTIFDPLVQRDF